jgi:L-fuculose-phosphate aldolase
VSARPRSGARGSGRSRRASGGRGPGVRVSAAEREARAALVETCRRLHARDLIGAGEGNVSVRLGERRFLVTPSGADKGYLAPGELVVVDASGAVVAGSGRASTELRMHLAAYAARPDVHAVVHAHPLTAVALTVAGLPPPNDLVPEAAVTLGEIAIAPFATPGTDEVPASLAPLWARHDVLLLERHGALALGRTLAEAFDRMETLERVARVALVARLAGRCEPLPAAAVAKVLAAAGKARR